MTKVIRRGSNLTCHGPDWFRMFTTVSMPGQLSSSKRQLMQQSLIQEWRGMLNFPSKLSSNFLTFAAALPDPA